MKNLFQLRIALHLYRLLLVASAALLCAPVDAETRFDAAFDKSAVKTIDVKIDPENLDVFGFIFPMESMTEQIIKNLSDWKFPVRRGNRTPGSHSLKAHIGRITHQSTPVGFSFSSGNSDPRAQDFQKADVITVDCNLISNQNQAAIAEHSMEFSVGSMAGSAKNSVNQKETVDKLTDQISTACFTLLDDLQLGETGMPTAESVSKPGWMPSIRVEVVEEEDGAKKDPDENKNKVDANENDVRDEEPRKQLIIHNQGTPLILKLGHERL